MFSTRTYNKHGTLSLSLSPLSRLVSLLGAAVEPRYAPILFSSLLLFLSGVFALYMKHKSHHPHRKG
jgi:hypothetical protein